MKPVAKFLLTSGEVIHVRWYFLFFFFFMEKSKLRLIWFQVMSFKWNNCFVYTAALRSRAGGIIVWRAGQGRLCFGDLISSSHKSGGCLMRVQPRSPQIAPVTSVGVLTCLTLNKCWSTHGTLRSQHTVFLESFLNFGFHFFSLREGSCLPWPSASLWRADSCVFVGSASALLK